MTYIDIHFYTLLKIIGLGALTYIFTPFFLVMRDKFLWLIIRKFILNKKLFECILEEQNHIWQVNNNFNGSIEYTEYESGLIKDCFIDEKSVTPDGLKSYQKAREFHLYHARILSQKINSRSQTLSYLIRHYKQDGERNMIEKYREDAYKRIK